MHFAQRELVGGHPIGFDQIMYLDRSYTTFEQMLTHGPIQGFIYGLRLPVSQGIMIHPQAALLFLLIGPSRLSALFLNFLYFAFFQFMLVYTLRWLTNRWNVAFCALGFLLSAASPWAYVGGLIDFRVDFMALFVGAFLCLAIRAIIGILALVMSDRRGCRTPDFVPVYNSSNYFFFFIGDGSLFCHSLPAPKKEEVTRTQTLQRIKGLNLAAGLGLLVTLPAIWWARNALWNYYVFNLTSHENKVPELRVRCKEGFHRLYLCHFFAAKYIRESFLIASALALFILIVASIGRGSRDQGQFTSLPKTFDRTAAAAVLLSCFVALLVLTDLAPTFTGSRQYSHTPMNRAADFIRIRTHRRREVATKKRELQRGFCEQRGRGCALTLCVGMHQQLGVASGRGSISQHSGDERTLVQLYEEMDGAAFSWTGKAPRIFGRPDPRFTISDND